MRYHPRMRSLFSTSMCAALVLLGSGCPADEEDPIPLEDAYTYTIQSGKVCAPSQAHTGTDDPVPLRYDLCVYRCIGSSGPFDHPWVWNCESGTCKIDIVPTWQMEPVINETDCDARDLVDPPADECNPLVVERTLNPPKNSMGEFVEQTFVVNFPYLDLEQSQTFQDSIDGGTPFREALDGALGGLQVLPERQFNMEFSAAAPVMTHADLTDADCHDIPLP